jgi:hypothetical protein
VKGKEKLKWKGKGLEKETTTIAGRPLGYDGRKHSEVMAGDVGWVV